MSRCCIYSITSRGADTDDQGANFICNRATFRHIITNFIINLIYRLSHTEQSATKVMVASAGAPVGKLSGNTTVHPRPGHHDFCR